MTLSRLSASLSRQSLMRTSSAAHARENKKTLIYHLSFIIYHLSFIIGSLVHGSLVHWFIGSLFIGSWVHWFIGSLIHWFIDSLIHLSLVSGRWPLATGLWSLVFSLNIIIIKNWIFPLFCLLCRTNRSSGVSLTLSREPPSTHSLSGIYSFVWEYYI